MNKLEDWILGSFSEDRTKNQRLGEKVSKVQIVKHFSPTRATEDITDDFLKV